MRVFLVRYTRYCVVTGGFLICLGILGGMWSFSFCMILSARSKILGFRWVSGITRILDIEIL